MWFAAYWLSYQLLLIAEAGAQARVLLEAVFQHSSRTKDLYQSLLRAQNDPIIHITKSLKHTARKVRALDDPSVIEQVDNATNEKDQSKAQARLLNLAVQYFQVLFCTWYRSILLAELVCPYDRVD